MDSNIYRTLAQRLDSLPNGFPPTLDGVELKLLEHIFTPEEASLAARLRLHLETPEQIALRLGEDPKELREQLKSMARRGLIAAGRMEEGIGFKILPFVVGIYENQLNRLDVEMARLFEDYYHLAFGEVLSTQPSVHRVIPIGESVRTGMEIHPFESAAEIVAAAGAWGVVDCICRKQKALVGEACSHPLDVCLVLHRRPGALDQAPGVTVLTREGAMDTLQRSARLGLVHSVSNTQEGFSYICNCCTCSCGILRGIAELGIANAVARSAFVNQVEAALCVACEDCLEYCQFGALSLQEVVQVDSLRCVGCGVCVPACPEAALGLVRRPDVEVAAPPMGEMEWLQQRATARGIDLSQVL
jgi:Na+-translocating ferredoxin:NAD+ oxidoreductase subunit B